ncbi:MAG: ABC transporter ATP-binding protein [Candidatus Hermodarchaeia archaeon]|jgi:putative ABC transport system ATP-binding protein
MDDIKPSIKLDRVSKTYTLGRIDVVALNDVSFEIPRGEFLVLLGPSGSGKTTLLNLIGGLDSPTVGRIEVNGFEVSALNKNQLTQYRRTQIGFIFQTFNLIPTLTARENVEFAAELVKNRISAEELLESVGLGPRMNHFPSELSGGETQRVAIARSLATDPQVILCDEPTGSLDFETGKRIFKLLRELNQTRLKTVVVVTHNSPIGEMADRIMRMRDGRIVEIISNPNPLDPERLEW